MDYTRDEFINLMQDVEDQSGEHLDAQCSHRKYSFSGPQSKEVTIAGCGNSSLFEVPYVCIETAKDPVQRVLACAVDDNMGMWPRFGGDRFASIDPDPQDLY